MRLEGWLDHVREEGGGGWIGGSSGDPDLTNELIAGEQLTHPHHCKLALYLHLQSERERQQNIFGLCAQCWWWWEFDENIYCLSPAADPSNPLLSHIP